LFWRQFEKDQEHPLARRQEDDLEAGIQAREGKGLDSYGKKRKTEWGCAQKQPVKTSVNVSWELCSRKGKRTFIFKETPAKKERRRGGVG